MPRLHFHFHGRHVFTHPLRPTRTLIGRSDRCDISLPSETVSRVHCWIEPRGDELWVCNRSQNGTYVNGRAVERERLTEGDRVDIGDYQARIGFDDAIDREGATTVSPLAPATHEELVVFTRGALEGKAIKLTHACTTLGGPGSDVVLDSTLPRDAVRVRVVRSRVMIEPGGAGSTLAGSRVRETTPAFPGEEVKVSEHAFIIALRTEGEEDNERSAFGEMVGTSGSMRRLFGVLARVAAHDAPVLLAAESGCGKELAAKAVHTNSPRGSEPFVAVNCAAIADNLFESEVFGHEKGAFTGATHRQDGAFHQADGGTLFLDEVGELKLELQAKLLRALESGEVRRVGAATVEYPDVRIIAATNRNLSEMVQNGSFRRDLFFRLAVLTIRLPPLRERGEDIPILARTLLERQHPGSFLTDEAARALQEYGWPGNVRELRNVLTRAIVLSGPVVHPEGLQFNPWAFDDVSPVPVDAPVDDFALTEVLRRHGGNRARAARELGIPRSSLLYKLKRMGLET
jgi:DNA-binding NtrC family response regulator